MFKAIASGGLLLFLFQSGICFPASVINTNAVDPNLFSVSTFTAGLQNPLGATHLADGSLLVGAISISGNANLIRFVDSDHNGVADGPGSVAYTQIGGGAVTGLVKAGDYVVAGTSNKSPNQAITILQPGANPADPLNAIGSLNLTFPANWEHPQMGVAVRPVQGQPGAYDVVFNVGSQYDAQTSTDAVAMSGLLSGTLDGDSLYMVRLQMNGSTVSASNLTKVANGIRNVVGMGFQPGTGDFYFVDNAMDGPGVDGDEPPQADELNKISAAALGTSVVNFGYPNCYIQYRTGAAIGSGCVQPIATFQPLPNGTLLGQESEGPVQMAFAPSNFPTGFNNGIFVGFAGKGSTGVSNEENALVYYDFGTGKYLHFFESGTPGGGLPIGLFADQNSLFVQDFALGTVTEISSATPEPGTAAGTLLMLAAMAIHRRRKHLARR